MDHTFRFILEEPNGGPSKGQNNRKRARLVTACDNCRLKKIKCIRTTQHDFEAPCEACKLGSTDCSYADRDRYQSERGLSFASTVSPVSTTPIPQSKTPTAEDSTRKRKASIISSVGESEEHVAKRRDSGAADMRPGYNHHFSQSALSGSTLFSPTHGLKSPEQGAHPLDLFGDSALKRITVPFFRYFGPTANTPGYRRVKVRTLTLNEVGSPVSSSSDSALPGESIGGNLNYPYRTEPPPNVRQSIFSNGGDVPTNFPSPSASSDLFDPVRPRYPSAKYLPHLAGLFFDHLACHFPFLDRTEVMEAVENETLPAVMANSIAALACRFSNMPDILKGGKRYVAGEPFADMSKLLIVQMLSWPSLEVLQALILIAWSEFGSGRDSGLWMWSRSAVAMAIDLGLQYEATVQLAGSHSEKEKIRLTWWSTVLIDRINSWGTGRPIAIADDQFDTALPLTTADGQDFSKPPPPSLVFGHLARLVQLRGRMGDVLNNQVKRNTDLTLEMELTQLQYEMTTWYQGLTPSLVFNIQNFRRFSAHKQSSIFLLLHCMFHSVITLLHRPSLLQRFTPDVALPLANSIDVSRSSARSLVDMVSLADELDMDSLIANPFLDLPILTAARAFLAEREYLAKPPPNMPSMNVLLMRQWSETSLDRCKDALKKMSKFWGGVGCVKRILDQQSAGDLDFDVGEGSSGDTHVSHLRDVELITQWATKAWRRHTGSKNSNGLTKLVIPPEARPQVSSLLSSNSAQTFLSSPTTATTANSNSAAGKNVLQYLEDSPAGATVGISGVLDGAFGLIPLGTSDAAALRVSFNAAEADLSFPNSISTELFSIPDGLEEFLGTTMDVGSSGGGHVPQANERSALDLSQASLLAGANGAATNGTLESAMSIPAFSTLIGPWFPMGQFSRASSPAPMPSK